MKFSISHPKCFFFMRSTLLLMETILIPRMKDRQINVASLRFLDTSLEEHFSSEKEKRSGAAFCCCVLVLFFITAMEVFIDPLWVFFSVCFVCVSAIQMCHLCCSHPAWPLTMWLWRSERYCCWFSPCAPWLPPSPGWEQQNFWRAAAPHRNSYDGLFEFSSRSTVLFALFVCLFVGLSQRFPKRLVAFSVWIDRTRWARNIWAMAAIFVLTMTVIADMVWPAGRVLITVSYGVWDDAAPPAVQFTIMANG